MRALAAALAIGMLACGTSDVGVQDGAADGPAEASSPDAPKSCPPTLPQGAACNGMPTCNYPQATCTCMMGFWHCLDVRCPPKGQMPASCAESFTCDYGFEEGCGCRDGHWLCCGGIPSCDPTVPTNGYPCCGVVQQCGYACNGTLCAIPNGPMTCNPEATQCTCSGVWSCTTVNSCIGDAGPG